MKPAVLPPIEWPSKVKFHTVTFVRHAEKTGGGFSADLTEKGRLDSEVAGSRIGCNVDLFIASPSPRTVSTALGIRKGNGSTAPVVNEDQLAEPGLGYYYELRPALKSMLKCILQIVDDYQAETVVCTTHNYVLGYLSTLPGCRGGDLEYLSGITFNIEILEQLTEML